MESTSKRTETHNQDLPEHANPENKVGYRILNSPELRIEYLACTDSLIYTLIKKQTDVAIFLDKSARPVAWFVKELWEDLAPRDSNGKVPTLPDIKFLNIDREQWGVVLGRSEDEGGFDVGRMPAERLKELRKLYAPIKHKGGEKDETLLTNKNVMVVDEVRVSGDTLAMSRDIIKKAFPDANSVESVYWMDGQVRTDVKTGIRSNTKLPVWYSDKKITGRLIGNRDATKSALSSSERVRAGRFFLSTPFREGRDEDGLQLKNEIKMIGSDVRAGRLLYKPDYKWNDSELEDRLLRINGLSTEEYVRLIKTSPDDLVEQNSLYIAFRNRERVKKIGRTASIVD